MELNNISKIGLLTLVVSGLAACGGADVASIGGTLSGLSSGNTVVLQNKLSNDLTLSSNGSFTFSNKLDALESYDITVRTQPAGQTCSVSNGSGKITILGATIRNVTVTCTVTSSLSGVVSGLASGRSLTLSNAGVLLPIANNGSFVFPASLAVGATYNLTVSTQPVGQSCSVSGGSGTVVANTPINATVTCI